MQQGPGAMPWPARLGLAVVLTVAGAGGGYAGVRALTDGAAASPAHVAHPARHASAPQSPAPAASGTPSGGPTAALIPAPAVPAGVSLAAARAVDPAAPAPLPAVLAARIDAAFSAKALGTRPAGTVVDALTGAVLYDSAAGVPLVPASTAKLATATAALVALGPDARLSTRVVDDPAAGTVTIVGGGDPTLTAGAAQPGFAAARLDDLARATVTALRGRGQSKISLRYDASVFSGPATAAGWKPGYVSDGNVGRVVGLMVDGGRVQPGRDARSPDPAAAAAVRFAALLHERGIAIVGEPRSGAATGDEIAAVPSPPVKVLVEQMLVHSDNDIAEALARAIAHKTGAPATFPAGGAAVAAAVAAVGVPGLQLVDGSGLSRDDRIAPAALAALVRLATLSAHPELRPVVAGLPVAGFTGTLATHFGGRATHRFAGVVRAKTGTLAGVTSLAGTVVDADGRLLVFAFVSNRPANSPVGTRAPADGLDVLVAQVAACGCR